ncbi:MAG: NAD(P)-dependent alcohol dehydrogenase [Chloroflexi bacterium]|nr:NAD(P)-dependent alcohol dehydrogenase [Chloroflexota bacterium]
MKAVVCTRYGPPEVLHIQDVEKPSPNDVQVLVRVHAASLNPAEAHMRKSKLIGRIILGTGLVRPKNPIIGADFAGQVEAVGRNVTGLKPGDQVFGRKSQGGFAEYVCVTEKPIGLKPANISFEQASAVPVAAITALQSLRDRGQVQPGQKVLIHGAAGGVGTFAVQIAKAFGADVTGVCSSKNLKLVRSLGADRVIDYTRDDFTRNGQQYDVIIDNVGNRSLADCLRALNPNGICVGIGYTSMSLVLQHFVLGRFVKTENKKIGGMLARITKEDLTVLKEMMEKGQVVPFVEKCYPLNQVSEAYRYLETKHASGKLVVTFE